MNPTEPDAENPLSARVLQVKDRIREAAVRSGRDPESVRLVAVSKTVPMHRIQDALEAGITLLGENYIQEAQKKVETLTDRQVSWHFIGHLQSNKAKYAVRLFDLVQTVDSLKLALELDRHAGKRGKVQEVLIQVNFSQEAAKSGASPEEVLTLAEAVLQMENLSLRGLMTLPPFFDQPERARPFFAALKQLGDRLREQLECESFSELSMGMTGDFEVAVEEGATLVRVGTAVFGKRL